MSYFRPRGGFYLPTWANLSWIAALAAWDMWVIGWIIYRLARWGL